MVDWHFGFVPPVPFCIVLVLMSPCFVNDEMAYLNEGMMKDEGEGDVDNESYYYILH